VIFLLGGKDAPPRGKLKLPYCGLRGPRTTTVCRFKTARRAMLCARTAADNKMQSATLAHMIVFMAVSACCVGVCPPAASPALPRQSMR